ncbi:MAG: Gfo/Idh/MocA family oxidoreductase [Verrucomicrobiota bacterium]
MQKLRWGILGAGWIARKFVHSLRATESSEIIAVASETEGKAQAFADELAIPHAYSSYEALLSNPDVDVVYIANIHNFHLKTALLALEAEKHVLCEKPLAINAAQGLEMVLKARAKKRFLMEAMWTRFLPAVVQLRDWIHEGRIGEVETIDASFGFVADLPLTGRLLNPALAGGALLDLGIYPLSFASMAVNGQKPIALATEVVIGETGVDVDSVQLFRYPKNRTAILRCSFIKRTPNTASITGSLGSIQLSPTFIGTDTVTLETDEETLVRRFPCPENEGFKYEIEHVVNCIHEGKLESPVMPLKETLAIAETMDELRVNWGLSYPDE